MSSPSLISLSYPKGTVDGFYPVIGKDNKEKFWAPLELIKRDTRHFVHNLKFLLPQQDFIIPIANGGGEVGQEFAYKLGRRAPTGRSIALNRSAQTRGYDETGKPYDEIKVLSVPTAEELEGAQHILIADDMSEHYTAMRAVRSIVRDRAPKDAVVTEAVVWVKTNGAERPLYYGRAIENVWIELENQREDDADGAWYLDQVMSNYPHYLEDINSYVEERRHPLPDPIFSFTKEAVDLQLLAPILRS